MTEQQLPDPLVPAEVDLRDFAFMPVDVQRLLKSDTWILGTGEERAAAFSLWAESWHQVPASSLPDNDRVLQRLSQCNTWRRVRAHVMRGWVKSNDGRLYHPVVAEKALEAWLEKLAQRISGGNGNAKRWNVSFDPTPIERQMQVARELLQELNPASRALTKRRTSGIPPGSRPDSQPDGKSIPPGSRPDSQPDGKSIAPGSRPESRPDSRPESPPDRKGQGQGQGQGQLNPNPSGSATSPHVELAVALRAAGVKNATPQNPDVLQWAAEGITVEQATEAARVAVHERGKQNPTTGYLAGIVQDMRTGRMAERAEASNTAKAVAALESMKGGDT